MPNIAPPRRAAEDAAPKAIPARQRRARAGSDVLPALAAVGGPAAATMVLPGDLSSHAPTARRPLRVKARALRADTRIVPHSHPWAQVAFSTTGVLRLTAADHTYIVPPSRAVWIPPSVEHVVTVVEDAELRTLYLHQAVGQVGPVALCAGGAAPASAAAADWRRCRVLEVSALMRELVQQLHAADGERAPAPAAPQHPDGDGDGTLHGGDDGGGGSNAADSRERCITALLQDELCRARPLPLGVGLPADKRLRALCEAVIDDPARHATLAGWAGDAGASIRTVARLFRHELGTTFAEWRQQVLLAKALSMAAKKRPMSHIAAELGYASASAFTAMVSRQVGMPPSRFFAAG